MSVTIIYYEAKCKHCLFFHRRTKLNKNGNKSKVRPAFCGNIKSERFEEQLNLKTKACNKIEL